MNPALDYAENYLGVHRVHDEAESLLAELDTAMTNLDEHQDARRKLDEQIEDRQMDLLIEERGKAADISQAAMDRRLKEVYRKDPALQKLKSDRGYHAGIAAGLDLDIEHLKYRLKVKIARMEELGGYFQYLASVKNAEARTSPQGAAAGGEANSPNETGATQ